MFWRLIAIYFTAVQVLAVESQERAMETESFLQTPALQSRKEEQPVQVQTGAGARKLDANTNELGLELSNVEKLEELSTIRRAKPWWFKPKISKEWTQQLHADLSADQDIRLRTLGEKQGVETRVEVGVSRDHRPIPLLSDTQINIDGKKDSAFASLGVHGEKYQALLDADSKIENIFAGSVLTGEKMSQEQSAGGAVMTPAGKVTPFIQLKSVDFSSRISPIYSNTTRNWRTGLRYQLRGENWRFEPQISSETFDRTYQSTETSKYRRAELHLKGFTERKIESWHLRSHLFLQQLQDVHQIIRNDQTWDAGLEIAQARSVGWIGRLRSYSIAATPSQIFGDGGLLAGSPDLPSSKGTRGAIGLAGQSNDWKWEATVIAEQEHDLPLPVAVSPIRARTIPIGGVFSRGVEVSGEVKLTSITWRGRYSYQDAVNTSEVDWQRGQRVPGRPAHTAGLEFLREKTGWKQGLSYNYRSEDALDLTGLWKRPSRHDLGGYVGYGEKRWEIRLAAVHALAAVNKLPNADFAGLASPSLLEPTLEQTEVRFQCEILL